MLGGELFDCSTSTFWLNILQVIMIARLNAMYQQSRKMYIFLIVTFLAKTIPCGVISAVDSSQVSGGELTNNLNASSSWNESQRNLFCPTPICAFTREWTSLRGPRIGYSSLHGRSSYCVLQSGLLSDISGNCTTHPQALSSGTVSRC